MRIGGPKAHVTLGMTFYSQWYNGMRPTLGHEGSPSHLSSRALTAVRLPIMGGDSTLEELFNLNDLRVELLKSCSEASAFLRAWRRIRSLVLQISQSQEGSDRLAAGCSQKIPNVGTRSRT